MCDRKSQRLSFSKWFNTLINCTMPLTYASVARAEHNSKPYTSKYSMWNRTCMLKKCSRRNHYFVFLLTNVNWSRINVLFNLEAFSKFSSKIFELFKVTFLIKISSWQSLLETKPWPIAGMDVTSPELKFMQLTL